MRTVVFTAILFLLVCGAASAEFYRYVDQHGNVLYTDDLSKVPIEQRKSLEPYQNSPATPVPTRTASETVQPSSDKSEDIVKERTQLEQQEQKLKTAFEHLTKERDTLDSEKEAAVTPDQIKAYNQRVADFNVRIKDYEKSRDSHTEKVKSFNERLNNSDAPERK